MTNMNSAHGTKVDYYELSKTKKLILDVNLMFTNSPEVFTFSGLSGLEVSGHPLTFYLHIDSFFYIVDIENY